MRKRIVTVLGVAIAGSQAGHLLAYQLHFGAAAQRVQSSGVHAYFPLLARTSLGIAAIVLGASFEDYAAAGVLGGVLLILTGLIFGVAGSQVAVPKKIDERFVWIKKVHPAFLAELPVYTY